MDCCSDLSNARDRWLNARRSELLAAPYSHVVFTLPHELAPLALQNKEVMYGLLFRSEQRARPLAQRAAFRAAGRAVLPRRFHAPTRTGAAGPAKQGSDVWTAVPI